MLTRAKNPVLVVLVGAPGTGKSTLARRLQAATGAMLVQTDQVRKQLFAEPRYNSAEHAAVYGWCLAVIRSALRVGRPIIFDATNLAERNRRRLYQVAEQCQARLLVVWTTCSPRVVQERMIRRRDERDEGDLSDADWGVYLQLRRQADPIPRPHLLVNTGADLAPVVRLLAARIQDGDQPAAPAPARERRLTAQRAG